MGYSKIVFNDQTLIDLTSDTVKASDLITGVTAHGADGEVITGNIPRIEATNKKILSKSEVYSISKGYHDGEGTVSINDDEQAKIIPENIKSGVKILGVNGVYEGEDSSDATAVANEILIGKTAYANKQKLIGSMPNNDTVNHQLSTALEVFFIPEGYHNGEGVISVSEVERLKIIPENIRAGINILGVQGTHEDGLDTTDATATANEILENRTAYVNGQKLTGNMTNRGAVSGVISSLDDGYVISEGYHNGNGTVVISDTEKAKITPDNIKSGITILGVQGIHEGSGSGIDLSNDTVTADRLRSGYTAHGADGQLITGTLATAALEPYEYDYNCGYIDNGVWKYERPTQTYIDIYEVIEGHNYFFTLGVNVGSRYRVMFTTTDITRLSGGSITGEKIVDAGRDAPVGLENFKYVPSSNGYLMVGKDNVGKTGIKTYLYDITAAWL